MMHESVGRCTERWQATGLSFQVASELADDPEVGAPLPSYHPQQERPVTLLLGPIGAGKSLIVERLLQSSIRTALTETEGPIPVYLDARRLEDTLMGCVKRAAEPLGNLRVHGAAVVIDRGDELGMGPFDDLLAQSRTLVKTWPNTTVMIASRPLPSLVQVREAVHVEALSTKEALALVTKVVGREVQEYSIYRWPSSVQEAIKRPLFAVLLGVYLRDSPYQMPRSTADLLSFLVEQALGRVQADRASADAQLNRLAVQAIESGRGLVHESDLDPRHKPQSVFASRLVVEGGHTISFALPILMEWFGAHALEEGTPPVSDLIGDPIRLEKWRNPLIIAVGYLGYRRVSDLLAPVVEHSPALGAEVIVAGMAEAGLATEVSLPSSSECKQQVNATMQAFVRGLGRLAQLLSLADSAGKVRSCHAWANETTLTTEWYLGGSQESETDDDTSDAEVLHLSARSSRRRSGRPSPHHAWAWRWALEEAAARLSDRLRSRGLPVSDGPIAEEWLWKVAVETLRRSRVDYRPISLAAIEQSLPSSAAHKIRMTVGSVVFDPDTVRAWLEELRAKGITEILAPWPGPDVERSGHWIWSGYSPEQLLARTQMIYGKALQAYQQLVQDWFQNFATYLQMSVYLPAHLVGTVTPPRSENRIEDGPVIMWRFEALPRGQDSQVIIVLGDQRSPAPDLRGERERLRILRPEAAGWLNPWARESVLDIFGQTPVTELAYRWLWDDLKRVSWVKGSLGSRD